MRELTIIFLQRCIGGAVLIPKQKFNMRKKYFHIVNVKSWLEHDAVLQGGELTGWPKLLDGDDMMLHWIQEAKRMRKKIEGHFPGASEKTLAKMMLLGADSDHEAMTGEEVYDRLMQGYMVSLRNSSKFVLICQSYWMKLTG